MNDYRLDRMIDNRGLSPEARRKVLDRLVEANVARDDPLSVIFVLEANIEKAAQGLSSLPDRMTTRLRTDLTNSNSALVAGLRETVRKTLNQTSAQAIRQARRNAVIHLAAAGLLAATAVGGLGMAVGAQIGQDRSASFLETLAASPEAESWERLMRRNMTLPAFISTHCAPGNPLFIPESGSGPACRVALWIGDAPPPAPAGLPARLRVEIINRLGTIPAWLAMLIGMLIALAAQPLLRRVWTDSSNETPDR